MTLETCDLWDIWSEWWSDPTHTPNSPNPHNSHQLTQLTQLTNITGTDSTSYDSAGAESTGADTTGADSTDVDPTGDNSTGVCVHSHQLKKIAQIYLPDLPPFAPLVVSIITCILHLYNFVSDIQCIINSVLCVYFAVFFKSSGLQTSVSLFTSVSRILAYWLPKNCATYWVV